MYAEIAVNTPVNQTYYYHIPEPLADKLSPGHLVQVAFGTAHQYGIVLSLHETSPVAQTKPVNELLDSQPVVIPMQIELARWISQRYLTPIGLCLWLMLPPGLTGGRDIRLTLLQPESTSKDLIEQKLIALLQKRGGTLTGRRIEAAKALQGQHWRPAADALAKEGIVAVERILTPPRARPKIIQTALLAIHPDQIAAYARHLGRESRRADILEVLAAVRSERPTIKSILQLAGTARDPLKKLVEAELVTLYNDDVPPTVSLNIPRHTVDQRLVELRGGEKHLHILKVLARQSEPIDVSWLYAQTGANLNDLKRLEEEGLILLGEKHTWRDSLAERDFVPADAPPLTPEQRAVWTVIEEGIGQAFNAFLLHGVTGSGKTEIYLRAIERTLEQGRGAIFLVPEIAMTAQTVRRVAARFPGRTAIVHSGLSDGERYDTWRRAREGLIGVVVGARSALFTPLSDIGLVILDEEHDTSYKQSEPVPHYHARDVAEQMMSQNRGTLILGSATPDVETVYRAEQGDVMRLRLPTRIMGHRVRIGEQSERTGVFPRYRPAAAADVLAIDLPPVQVVDMREELKAGNTSIFSRELQTALAEILGHREQAILFLNRRGASTYVFCRDCGYVAACPRCDTPLTYHRHGELLHCHRCGFQTPEPTICPQCGSKRIKYFGAGTQQVESALIELFPKARPLRWDADTVSNHEMHDVYLQRFIERKADILIGTQMVAKGLDLPLVTLVGVVSADMGLNLPDFRAGERSFQVLTQVAGRAGRGLLGGRVVLQTYQPQHYAIVAASTHDFDGFYQQEITYRRELGYPPFRRLARVVFRDVSETRAMAEAERAAAYFRARLEQLHMTATEIIGPAPCFFTRVNNVYRWHLLLRGSNPAALLEGADLTRGWQVDIDPVDVL
jgi:primosomal protein N' (replication factor Y)